MNNENQPVAMWSADGEAALISCALNGPRSDLEEAVSEIDTAWFFSPLNAMCWGIIRGMVERRQPVDLITFTEAVRQAGELDKIDGGAGYLAENFMGLAGSAVRRHWMVTVKDYWRRREMVRIAGSLATAAREFTMATDDVLDAHEKMLLDMRVDGKREGLVHCASAVDEAVTRIEATHANRGKPIGVATGFVDFDRMTGGLRPGQLVIIAARPSMGKSAFAMNIAENACVRGGLATAVFSLEMTSVELMERILCSQSDVKIQRVRDGFMSKDEMKELGRKMMDVQTAPLYVDETPSLTISAFRARARRAVAKHGVKLLIVDYLQLMKGSTKRAAQDRRLEIDEISSGLKATAKELGVPVIALSQLNRDAEERAEPKLSHLRESGSIEQDADVVALLHRPERVTHKEEDKGKAVLILAKQRNGPVGRIELTFMAELARFGNATGKLYSNKDEERQK